MLLSKYGKWESLYDDQEQCFQKAIALDTDVQFLIITQFQPERLSKSTKLLIPDCLYNYIEHEEDEHGYHIVLKIVEGPTLKHYLKSHSPSYQTRVQMAYQWLKSILKYEQLSDALKIQLVDDEQLTIYKDHICAREWIDFGLNSKVLWQDVFKQIGLTLDVLLFDAKDHHSQWIENLITGNHEFISFSLLRKHFKDVFIYEKDEALEHISYEYHIVLKDTTSPLPVPDVIKELKKAPIPSVSVEKETTLTTPIEEPQRSTAAYEGDVKSEEVTDIQICLPDETATDDEIVTEEALSTEPIEPSQPVEDYFQEHDLPEQMPKASLSKRRDLTDDDFLEDPWGHQEDQEDDHLLVKASNKKRLAWFISFIAIIILVAMIYLFTRQTSVAVEAKFDIEPLRENRVAFMNRSKGSQHISEYLWEIYYKNQLVHAFSDENLFPIFESEGIYTIVFRVLDKNGIWSEPYTLDYEYVK